MAVVRARFIPEVLQVHLDDLAFIAGQRRAALTSQRHTLREFGELSERLEAHVQGALIAPADALLDRLQSQLSAPDRDEAFAAACVLLRTTSVAAENAVIVEFSRARGAALAGLRDALSLAPAGRCMAELHSAFGQAKPATAAAATVALANQRQLDRAAPRLATLLEDGDPAVCELAWRAALMADAAKPSAAPVRPFQSGTSNAAIGVRDAAWAAMAWSGQPTTLPWLRSRAEAGDAVALQWLAILGTADDALQVQKAALALEDVNARCMLLARFGHPSALNALVRWMSSEDIVLSAAAGAAFTRITGQDIRAERRSWPVAEGADEFDRDMAPDLWMPDVKKALSLMQRHAERWIAGTRWCQGLRLDGEVSRELLLQLDLQARWDAAARAALAGRPISAPPPIH